jgi:hypothetical protein
VAVSQELLRAIEELRRELHRGLGSQYDPVRLQALAPISEELDRLAVAVGWQELSAYQPGAVEVKGARRP